MWMQLEWLNAKGMGEFMDVRTLDPLFGFRRWKCCDGQCIHDISGFAHMLGSKGFVGELLHIDLPEVSPMAAPDPKFKSNQWSCNSLADGNKSLLTIKQEVAERKAQLQAHFTS